jgi:hypothetical protein
MGIWNVFCSPPKILRFIVFFGRQDSLEAHLVCNIFNKWREVAVKWCGEKTHDNEKISFGPDNRSMMIDFNDMTCVLKGDNPVNNINIFLERTPQQNLNNTWIALMNLMNVLWSM